MNNSYMRLNLNNSSTLSLLQGYLLGFKDGRNSLDENFCDNYMSLLSLMASHECIEPKIDLLKYNANQVFKRLYNKDFDFTSYEDYLKILDSYINSDSKLYLYSTSVRCDFEYNNKTISSEYDKEEDLLVLTYKTKERIFMKEATLDTFSEVLSTF